MVLHDIAKLEGQIKELDVLLKQQSNTQDVDELLHLIHNPGWTTIAEYALVVGVLEALTSQMKQVSALRGALINASRGIGKPQNA